MKLQFRISTLSLFVAVVALFLSVSLLTARHNAQLISMTARHNAQLISMTARHNAQLTEQTERHNDQLIAQAAAFEKERARLAAGPRP